MHQWKLILAVLCQLKMLNQGLFCMWQQKMPLPKNKDFNRQQQHETCMKGQVYGTKQSLERKVIKIDKLKINVQDIFDKLIDGISDTRDKIIQFIESKVKEMSLSQSQHYFNQCFGNQACSIKLERQDMKLQQLNSSIVTNLIDFQKLKAFFSNFPKQPTSFQVIFKASENQFSIPKFYLKCSKQTDTIIICKTNKDKVIGAYTPLSHNPDNTGGWNKDHSMLSFTFSLTNNDKFCIQENDHAICKNKNNNNIWFGYNGQFCLKNKAHQSLCCHTASINLTYYNQKYSDSRQSYIRLNGNQSPLFSTKQWEVWKVKFQ